MTISLSKVEQTNPTRCPSKKTNKGEQLPALADETSVAR